MAAPALDEPDGEWEPQLPGAGFGELAAPESRLEHLPHRRVALLHQPQLHEHDRPPSVLRTRATTAKEEPTG